MDEFLEEAEEACRCGLYASAVVMSHTAVRLRLASQIGRDEGSLKDMASTAYRNGVDVDVKSLVKLSWMRNRIVHEGRVPSRQDAEWAIEVAERNLKVMKKEGLLRRVFRWLSN